MEWREEAPVPVDAPDAVGFGSRLIVQLMGQLRGDIRYDWRLNGLKAELSFTLRADADADDGREPASRADVGDGQARR
jgi:two-component sensor histidine kinase